MNAHQLLAQISNGPETLDQPRVQAVYLLCGFGLLALMLLILMLTRWGQAKPLSKCVALSMLAHVLLMAYAYGVRLFYDTPTEPREELITVTLISSDDEPQDQASPQQVPPWNDFPAESALPAEIDKPPSQDVAEQVIPEPIPVAEAEDPEPIDNEPPAPLAEPPQIVSPPAEVPMPEEPAPTPESIELPDDITEMPELQRVAAEPFESTPHTEESADPFPDVSDATDEAQRLADIPTPTDTAEAMADNQDATNRSNNEMPTPEANNETGSHDEDVPLVPVTVASAKSSAGSSVPVPAIAAKRPGDGRDLPAAYRARVASDRDAILAENGGNSHTEAAVQAALNWLAQNQESDGRWDCAKHGGGRETRVLGHDRGGAGTEADTAVTGLAVLAFLGAGHTHLEGDYQRNVQHALEYLLRIQTQDGDLAGNARTFARMYCHGMAALALSEAYAMTGDPRLRPYVDRAVKYTVRTQHLTDGGWRYQPGDPAGDTGQLGWQLMALRSAELAGIRLPSRTRAGMIRFLNSVAAGRRSGLASYQPRSYATRTMTAEALVCRLFLRLRTNQSATEEAVAFLMQETPQSGSMNLYYWYYATVALFQVRGYAWETWNEALQQRLLAKQERAGPLAGSWSPNTVWGAYGGRVYSTAMAALCLEVYYRYLPMYAVTH